jgi:hypothetical protein
MFPLHSKHYIILNQLNKNARSFNPIQITWSIPLFFKVSCQQEFLYYFNFILVKIFSEDKRILFKYSKNTFLLELKKQTQRTRKDFQSHSALSG